MKETIGQRIKTVANTIYIIAIIVVVIGGICGVLLTNGGAFATLMLIVGVPLSILAMSLLVLVIRGFGELIDTVSNIENELKAMNAKKI